MPPTGIETDLQSIIKSMLPDLVAIRHDLHQHPELGYEEKRTSGVVCRELAAAGVEHVPGLASTGVLGHLPGAADKAIGLRADMDALPILEQTDLPYASRHEGCMHACGHDGHTTMLIGAARVLAEVSKRNGGLPRPVTFVFQPAEEGGAGGRRMVEDGCLNGSVLGPPVENMFGLHGWPLESLGIMSTRTGPILAAADMWDITVSGHGAHAAMPHLGRDPVVAGSAIVTALQSIVSRNVAPLDSAVISVTSFQGGTTHNVIPERIRLKGTVRTLSAATKQAVVERFHTVVAQVAAAHGCTAEVHYQDGYPITYNSEEAVEIFERTARDAFGEDRVIEEPAPHMGGEDFSFYSHEVPSCFFFLGLRPLNVERVPHLHEPTFDFNDDALATGIEAFCRLALRAS